MLEPKTIPELLRFNAARHPAKLWARFEIGGSQLNFGQTLQQATLAAGGFQHAGVNKGDRVAVMLDNVAEFAIAWFGLSLAGAVLVPINTYFKVDEVRFILGHAGVKGVVTSKAYLDIVKNAAGDSTRTWSVDGGAEEFRSLLEHGIGKDVTVTAEDHAGILYTSGTTGDPKGCIESHRFYLRAGGSFRDIVGVREDDVVLSPLPLFHANPQIIAVMGSLMAGCAVVFIDRFHPRAFIESCRKYAATVVCYLGVMPAMMLNVPESTDDRQHSVRVGLGGGIPPRLHKAFEDRFGFPMIEAYGMSEAGNATMVDPRAPRLVGSGTCGRLCPGVEARLVDQSGQDILPGQEGEMLLKGPNLFSGYFRNDEANAAAYDEQGWFRTGDMLRADTSGNYYFVDRIRDVIRRSGENVSAMEVETVLRTFPAIADVAVVGVPDDVRGQEIKACIRLKDHLSKDGVVPEALAEFVEQKLAYFKVPRFYKFYDELPKTPTLKTRKFQLRSVENPTSGCWDRLTKSWR